MTPFRGQRLFPHRFAVVADRIAPEAMLAAQHLPEWMQQTPALQARMNRTGLLWRLAGVISVTAAWGTSLLHRTVLDARIGGPPSLWEWVLGLLSFALASFGAILLINGAHLREGWDRDDSCPKAARPKSPRI